MGSPRVITPQDAARHAEMLANRVRKTQRRLARAFERDNVGAYRLYDRDIPEVRAVVDWYEGHLVVAEYTRTQTAALDDYPETLARAVGRALGVPPERQHVKRRRTGPRRGYRRQRESTRFVVRERELSFWVDVERQLDCGLFLDHRDTRRMIAEIASGRSVLNLFAYTGSFTCWAAHGGARRTVSVDATPRYVEWAAENLELNGLGEGPHELVTEDVGAYLRREERRFDVIVIDPPSRSTRYGSGSFDVDRDHVSLLRAAAQRAAPGAVLLFSTNHQRFQPRLAELPWDTCEEITARTVPPDFRNRRAHRAWLLRPGLS